MGSRSEYICPKCKLTLELCGGYSVGMVSACQTYRCLDCKYVFDHYTPHDFSNADISPFERDHGPEGKGVPCPKCNGGYTEYWDPKYPCPMCVTRMDEGEMTMLWD